MGDSKRPSTSSLRRFISSRPYVTIAEIRRRFGLDDAEAMTRVQLNGTSGYVGLPEREAQKLEELWARAEVGLEFSAEVHAPVVIGVYPMRIARFVVDPARNGFLGERPAALSPELVEAPGLDAVVGHGLPGNGGGPVPQAKPGTAADAAGVRAPGGGSSGRRRRRRWRR